MVTPFQLAWTLLKAMPPMVPRDLDEQIGAGTFRTVYGRPGVPHVTKYGSGEGLANALLLERMSSMYPDVFEPEELHVAPREIAPLDFLMRGTSYSTSYTMTLTLGQLVRTYRTGMP